MHVMNLLIRLLLQILKPTGQALAAGPSAKFSVYELNAGAVSS